jgi:dTDP-4-dehydrorhamnose 3,5-epimerase-like enzyme
MTTQPGSNVLPLRVRGAAIHRLPCYVDARGSLAVAELGDQLPFAPQRYFLVYAVPGREVRGGHAHRRLHQFLSCVHGDCCVEVDDGRDREVVVLDSPHIGLHLAPMVWGVQYRFSADAVLLVLASAAYEAADYIRDYSTFLKAAGGDPTRTAP